MESRLTRQGSLVQACGRANWVIRKILNMEDGLRLRDKSMVRQQLFLKDEYIPMKKNKIEIMKRQAKARAKVRQKRKTRLDKASARIFERPPIAHMEPPKGFIAISSSQALMEYAKPLMEKNAESLEELNRRMELASSLWNLAVSRQKSDQPEYSRWMESAKAGAGKVHPAGIFWLV